ncbi:MAG: hypothetical protein ACTHU0_10290 [Kofleriaceae bacterium]
MARDQLDETQLCLESLQWALQIHDEQVVVVSVVRLACGLSNAEFALRLLLACPEHARLCSRSRFERLRDASGPLLANAIGTFPAADSALAWVLAGGVDMTRWHRQKVNDQPTDTPS